VSWERRNKKKRDDLLLKNKKEVVGKKNQSYQKTKGRTRKSKALTEKSTKTPHGKVPI